MQTAYVKLEQGHVSSLEGMSSMFSLLSASSCAVVSRSDWSGVCGTCSRLLSEPARGGAEGKIPVEYEHEIRRMLKLDDASRGPSVGHSPRLSTHPVSSPGQAARSGPATPLLAGTAEELGGEAAARVSLPGGWLGQGFKAITGRLAESERVASQLKAGVVVLVLAVLLLLQVSQAGTP